MGYSTNPKSIEKVRSHLELMVAELEAAAKDQRPVRDIKWAVSGNAIKLAYWIRQALVLARKNPTPQYKRYAELSDHFIIRSSDNSVSAVPKDISEIAKLADTLSKMTLSDLESVYEVVGALIQHNANAKTKSEFYFPDAALNQEDLEKLYSWAVTNGFHIIVGEGITVTSTDPGDLAWKP
jgi:hypothetical protein